MILTVLDRLIFLKLMPPEGDITTMKLVQETINDVGFTDSELAQLQFINLPDGRTQWDPEAAKDCRQEFDFGPTIYQIVKQKLQEASNNGKLPRDAIGIWDKFMEDTKLAVVPTDEAAAIEAAAIEAAAIEAAAMKPDNQLKANAPIEIVKPQTEKGD